MLIGAMCLSAGHLMLRVMMKKVHPGISKSRRKKILDDALFDFFSKEAIKSLKRDFSKFCSESHIWTENKRSKGGRIGKDSFTVYASKYFFEVLHWLTSEQRAVVEKFGFGCVLALSKTHIPSSFTGWLACCVDPQSSQIIVDDKIINLSKDSFHYILGLPNAGSVLVENSDAGLEMIMSLFQLSEIPHITFFGNKLSSNETLTEQQIFVCFMQVAVCCFLCPSTSNLSDTKYIDQLGDPERASRFDICQLVYKHLIQGITKTINFIKSKGRKPKVFEFCSYALAVYYLDSLDFGVHVAGTGVPRAVSWRGDMIKVHSELDRKTKRVFGRKQMRKDLASYYSNECNTRFSSDVLSSRHREIMHDKFGMTLNGKTIDGLIGIVQSSISLPLYNCNKSGSLVNNLLQFLVDAWPWYNTGKKFGSTPPPEFKNDIPKSFHYADTPVGLAKQNVDNNPITTAPAMHPVAKVKSRLTLHLPENPSTGLCQADLISPIGRINLSPSSGGKEPSKPAMKSVLHNLFANNAKAAYNAKGSQQAAIPVGIITPKPIMVASSPEVTITGASSFKDRQNQLAEDVDAVYNRTVHGHNTHNIQPTHKGASTFAPPAEFIQMIDVDSVAADDPNAGKRANAHNVLVILQPKNSLVFPLPENPRFPVSDDDIMHYCAIIELAYTHTRQKEYALIYHGVHCNYISLGQTLMRDGHIDNFLIPCFCRKLFEDKHPSKSGRHYFFSYIGECILDLSESFHENLVRTSFLGAASASKGKGLDLSDRLFFPICHLEHWFTFVVDFKWKLFIFLDSYYGPKSDYQRAV